MHLCTFIEFNFGKILWRDPSGCNCMLIFRLISFFGDQL